LRVIDESEGNLGVISAEEALAKARSKGLDLIEISPNAKHPIRKRTSHISITLGEKEENQKTKTMNKE